MDSRIKIYNYAGFVAFALGSLALLGWALDSPILASLGVDRIPMAPSTAVLLGAYGAAFLLRGSTPPTAEPGRIGRALVLVGCAVSLLLLIASAIGFLPRIESLGMTLSSTVANVRAVGHMSPVTAVCFLLAGAAYLFDSSARRPDAPRLPSRISSAVLILVCFVFLLGYLLGAPLLYGRAFIPPALSTIIAFSAMGIASAFSARGGRSGARRQPFVPAFALTVAGIVGTGYLNYRQQEREFRTEIESRLAAISELKLSELLLFRNERTRDASGFIGNIVFSRLLRRFMDDPSDAEAAALIENWIAPYLEGNRYESAYILDAQGSTRLSIPFDQDPRAGISEITANEIVRSGRPSFQDFFLDSKEDRARLSVIVPISDTDRDGRPLGLLVFRIDPSEYLYPFINNWPVPSRSGETLLVRREGNVALFLNDLRFKEKAALRLRVPLDELRVPAVMAALGREGIVEGTDYRGEEVIASIRAAPESPWAIISKIDAAEAYAPLRERMWVMIAIVTGFVAAGAASLAALQRSRELGFYREKAETANELRETTAFLENLLDYANAPIIVWDTDYRITRFNHAFESLSGKSSAELLGGPLDPLFPPEQAEGSLALIRETSTGRRWETVEIDIAGKDGAVRRVLWNSAPIFSPDGKTLIATIAQGHDITETKEIEQRLTEQLDELRRWQEIMLGRENRIIQLKKEVNGLLAAEGCAPRYLDEETGEK